MNRNFDIIRELLLQVEDSNGDHDRKSPWHKFLIENVAPDVVMYHARLLLDLGLLYPDAVNLDGKDENGRKVAKFLPDALTNEGHEFLESIRNPEIWKRTREGAIKIGSFGFDLIKDLAKGFIKTEIRKRTGIEI